MTALPPDPVLDALVLRLDDAYRAWLDGRRGDAVRELLMLRPEVAGSPRLMARAAQLLSQMGAHAEALAVQRQLAASLPGHPDILQGLAASEMAVGDLAEAERHLDRAIALDPAMADNWYNRSTLRRQTPERNHVADLRARLASTPPSSKARIPLLFALAKELEDLEEHDAAFAALAEGNDLRRAALSYRVEADIEAMAAIAQAFDRALPAAPATSGPQPIFILGLPRTGSTLVERILAAHGQVESLGELVEFPMALTRAAGGGGKSELIRRAAKLDPGVLGQAYRAAAAGYASGKPHFIDKMPSNFLYVGLIAPGLPDARIVHLRRRPLDALFAIYKTLFRMGYPYAYGFADLAAYYAAYRRLMAHWRLLYPGRVIDLDYETLVAAPEATIRALLAALGLDWQDECLAFHRLATPVATASAAQVREPIHARSVGLWRRYERQLAPLAAMLRGHGIDPEAAL